MRAAEFRYIDKIGKAYGWIDSDGVVLDRYGDIVGMVSKDENGEWKPDHISRASVNEDGSPARFRNRVDAAKWLVLR